MKFSNLIRLFLSLSFLSLSMCTLIELFLIVSACFLSRFILQLFLRTLENRRESYLNSAFFLDELLAEREKYKGVSDELDMTLNELSGY